MYPLTKIEKIGQKINVPLSDGNIRFAACSITCILEVRSVIGAARALPPFRVTNCTPNEISPSSFFDVHSITVWLGLEN